MKKFKLLWIEEETQDGLWSKTTYLYNLGEYEITICSNASDGEAQLFSNSFDVVLIDIRIPPGDNPVWEARSDGAYNRLGLDLVKQLYARRKDLLKKTGIYTNERWHDIESCMKECEISQAQFLQKKDAHPNSKLNDFIKRLI